MPSLPLAAILGVFTLAGSLGANKLYYVRNRTNRSPNAGPVPVRYRTYTRVNRQLFALIKMPALKLFLCRANLDWISRVEGRSAEAHRLNRMNRRLKSPPRTAPISCGSREAMH